MASVFDLIAHHTSSAAASCVAPPGSPRIKVMLKNIVCSGSSWTLDGEPIFDGSLLAFRMDGEWSRWRAVMPIPQAAALRPKLWLLRDEHSSPIDPESTIEQMTGDLVVAQQFEARWDR